MESCHNKSCAARMGPGFLSGRRNLCFFQDTHRAALPSSAASWWLEPKNAKPISAAVRATRGRRGTLARQFHHLKRGFCSNSCVLAGYDEYKSCSSRVRRTLCSKLSLGTGCEVHPVFFLGKLDLLFTRERRVWHERVRFGRGR